MILNYLQMGAGGVVGAALTYTAMTLVVVPLERADARKGLVSEVRATAAEAKAAEYERQIHAGEIVIASYQEVLKNVRAKEAAEDEQFEKDRLAFEAKLEAAGRECRIDAGDLEWLNGVQPDAQ